MECHVYDIKYYKALTMACYDMKCEDYVAQTLIEKKMVFMAKNGVAHMDFKAIMANNARANWNVVRKTYHNGDLTMPMEDCEDTNLFHRFANLDKNTQKP